MTKRYKVFPDNGLYQVWQTDAPVFVASHMTKDVARTLCAALNAGLTAEAIEGADRWWAVKDAEGHTGEVQENKAWLEILAEREGSLHTVVPCLIVPLEVK